MADWLPTPCCGTTAPFRELFTECGEQTQRRNEECTPYWVLHFLNGKASTCHPVLRWPQTHLARVIDLHCVSVMFECLTSLTFLCN